jgi:hypothetical protein
MQLNASNIHAAILQYLKDQKVALEHEIELTENHINHFVGQIAYTYNLMGEHVRAAIGTVGLFPSELVNHLESVLERAENKVEEALGIADTSDEPEVAAEDDSEAIPDAVDADAENAAPVVKTTSSKKKKAAE